MTSATRVPERMRTPLSRWVLLCGAAEAVGITAAAVAARASSALVGGSPEGSAVAVAMGLVVGGGLVEGTALALAEATALGGTYPRLRRRPFILVTVAVAGLGWATASLPAVLSGDEGAQQAPPLLLTLLGGAALGTAMGTLLGAVQAAVLRGAVRHPGRWVAANALAWTPAMAVIFLGAGAPSASTPTAVVIGLGTLTGAAAGALLGALLGRAAPSLGERPRAAY